MFIKKKYFHVWGLFGGLIEETKNLEIDSGELMSAQIELRSPLNGTGP